MIVKVKRQENQSSAACWQSFSYQKAGRKTVAGILDDLNYLDDLVDCEGNSARRIRWSCSCMQKMCGACAMLIDGVPALACCTFIDTDKQEVLTLEPLSKFPVISDLVVDRSCIAEHQKQALLYLGEKGAAVQQELEHQYLVAKCLKCGLCLEACPNYVGPSGDFYGAVMANEAYLLHSSSADRKKEIQKSYDQHFAAGCSKFLACSDVCPMKMPTLSSICYMNRKKK